MSIAKMNKNKRQPNNIQSWTAVQYEEDMHTETFISAVLGASIRLPHSGVNVAALFHNLCCLFEGQLPQI